jgi:hypothetical protein
MEDISKLLVRDLIIIGSIPISASMVDPEAVDAQTKISINEIVFDRCAFHARQKENPFVNAVILAQDYRVEKTNYGLHAEFAVRAHTVMKEHYTLPENL